MTNQDSKQKAVEFFQGFNNYRDAFKHSPLESLSHCRHLDPGRLTYIAEDFPNLTGPSVGLVELLKLLDHDRPIVREGALRGVQNLSRNPDFYQASVWILRAVAKSDSCGSLREMAIEILEDDLDEAVGVEEGNQWSQSKGCADLCCAPCKTCGKPAERGSMGQCSDCRWREFNTKERSKLEKLAAEAKRDPEWSGWVYSDDYHGGNEGFFDSVEDFMERVEDDFARDPMTPRPAYVWATVARRIVNIGVDDVLGLITEDRPEDFETSDCNGLDELKAALEAFNSANQDFMYEPDRTTIVPIRWKEAK